MMYKAMLLLGCVGSLVVTSTNAFAADLGGDCCADLEERLATLEATAARKGNKKVSLKISGHVNQSLMIWDNGVDSDVYVLNNASSTSRLRFKGGAKINSDWSAAYTIEIGFRNALATFVDENNDDNNSAHPGAPTSDFEIRHSAIHLKHKGLGQLTIGRYDGASRYWLDHSDFSRSYVSANGVYSGFWNENFSIMTASGVDSGLDWGDIGLDDQDIIRQDVVRFDSAKFAGFKFGASWGEDDFYDFILKWDGKVGDFSVSANVMYQWWNDGFNGQYRCSQGGPVAGANAECKTFGGSLGFQHNPTGLFLTGGLSERQHEAPNTSDSKMYRVKGGIKSKFNSFGKTAIYAEYYKADSGLVDGKAIDASTGITTIADSELEIYGAGVVQWIDAASMQVYFSWRHYEANLEDATGVSADVEDFDALQIGARVQF